MRMAWQEVVFMQIVTTRALLPPTLSVVVVQSNENVRTTKKSWTAYWYTSR